MFIDLSSVGSTYLTACAEEAEKVQNTLTGGWGIREGGFPPYNYLYGEAPSERGTFSGPRFMKG